MGEQYASLDSFNHPSWPPTYRSTALDSPYPTSPYQSLSLAHTLPRQHHPLLSTEFPGYLDYLARRAAEVPPYKMEPLTEEEEFANLQKLSNEYEPEVGGPLVDSLRSSDDITAEYAKADPIYVQKTAALPQKYSHYRPIKGDGNCGWRAIAFGYFETLLKLGDKGKLVTEQVRLKSLNNLLNTVGFAPHLYEDFVEETLDLLKNLAQCMDVPQQGETVLFQSFQDAGISSAIITHFRLLTSAWMKTHIDQYKDFVLPQTVEQYCSTQIEPYQVEMEQQGMNALIDCLIKPAELAVEVLYLDRSPGQEVNSYRFEPLAADMTPLFSNPPTIGLIYRPGHYDLIYQRDVVQEVMSMIPPAPSLTSQQVQIASTYPEFGQVEPVSMGAGLDSESMMWMSQIPGMSLMPPPPPSGLPMGAALSPPTFIPPTFPTSPATFVPQMSPPEVPAPSLQQSSAPASPLPVSPPATEPSVHSFRPSKYEIEYAPPTIAQTIPLQTPAFKNSHYNQAHYRNHEFQPEMWDPELSYITRDRGSSSKKSP